MQEFELARSAEFCYRPWMGVIVARLVGHVALFSVLPALGALAACVGTPAAPAPARAAPIRVVLLNGEGVPMAGYDISPHLRSLGNELGRDIDYWAINDPVQPSLFVVGDGAVQNGCIDIHESFVGPRYLQSSRVCELTFVGASTGCELFQYRDRRLGIGYVVSAPLELTWRPSLRDQARVGDCVAEGMWALIPEAEVTEHARTIMYDYPYARSAQGPEL